jgi:Peptidase A4 family
VRHLLTTTRNPQASKPRSFRAAERVIGQGMAMGTAVPGRRGCCPDVDSWPRKTASAEFASAANPYRRDVPDDLFPDDLLTKRGKSLRVVSTWPEEWELRAKRIFTTALTAAALTCAASLTGMTGAASGSVTGTAATEYVPIPGGPIVRANAPGHSSATTISRNWSGYAATSAKIFTYVHSTFVQPAITCPGVANQWASSWVGLDGFTTPTVEQDGTDAYCGGPGNTTPRYEAWYEMYPADSVNVFAVHPGDIIDASVSYASGQFTLEISDLTTGKSRTVTAACSSCARASAEWIIERPALCNSLTNCFLTELADFGTSTMAGDEAQVAGGKVTGVTGFVNYPIDMIDPVSSGGFISLATVSALNGGSFTATWDRTGH